MKAGHTELYRTAALGASVSAYAEAHSTPLPQHIADYNAAIAASRDDSIMLSSNFQSQWHVVLARAIGAKRVLEIGVYVGYSGLVWAHAVGPDGLVTGLEFDAEYAKLAQDVFAANKVDNVDVIVGAAAETLPKLNPAAPYDIVFIDADKVGYPGYLRQLLELSQPGAARRLLRPGALIIADNALRRGFVVDDELDKEKQLNEGRRETVRALREFNDLAVANPRLETFLMPLWDGVNISRLVD